MITFEDLTARHILDMADKIRPEDVSEIGVIAKHTPSEALVYCLARSSMAYACKVDGEIACAFGVSPYSIASTTARPWMLSTHVMETHPVRLAVYSKKAVRMFLKRYKRLENYVDGRYTLAVKWIRWMGFTIEDAEIIDGVPVHFFHIERGE